MDADPPGTIVFKRTYAPFSSSEVDVRPAPRSGSLPSRSAPRRGSRRARVALARLMALVASFGRVPPTLRAALRPSRPHTRCGLFRAPTRRSGAFATRPSRPFVASYNSLQRWPGMTRSWRRRPGGLPRSSKPFRPTSASCVAAPHDERRRLKERPPRADVIISGFVL